MKGRDWSAGRLVLLVLGVVTGCQRAPDPPPTPTAAATERPFWVSFKRPAYADAEIDSLVAPLLDDIRQAADDLAERRRQWREQPRSARYRLVADGDVTTSRQVSAAYLQYRLRELELYRQHTQDAEGARTAGERFLEAYFRRVTSQPDSLSLDELRKLGEAALTAGARDPLIRLYMSWVWMETKEKEKAYEEVLSALNDYQSPPYLPRAESLARKWLVLLEKDRGSVPQAVMVRTYQAIDAMVRLLESEADEPDPRFTSWLMSDFLGRLESDQLEDAIAACLQSERVSLWHRHMLAGWYYRGLGWKYRGEGLAIDVTEEGWQKFGEYIPKAAAHYTRAWQLHPENPEAATMMINLAMTGGDRNWSPRDWFQQAIAAQLDHAAAYNNLSYALTPRWGGSHRQMLALARECLETNRWDTTVPATALRILFNIEQEIGSERPFGTYPGVAEVAAQFAEGLRRALAESDTCSGNTPTNWAFVAGVLVQAGRDEEARQIFEEQGDRLHQRDFDWGRIKLTYAKGRAFAKTGPAGEPVEQLDKFLQSPGREIAEPATFERLLDLLQQARTADPRPETEPYFRDVQAVLRQLHAFHAGEWVDLPFDDNLSGWYAIAEERELTPDGTLRLASAPSVLGIQLTPLARFTPPLVVQAELGLWPDKTAGRDIGLMHGEGDTRALHASGEMRGVFLSDGARYSRVYDPSDPEKYGHMIWPLEDRPFHLLRIKVWPGSLVYYADRNQLIHQKEVPNWQSGLLVIGEAFPTNEVNSLQVRNVRIRRLDYGPPPSWEEMDRWPEFYGRERDLDPEDGQPYLFLAIECYRRADYEPALEFLKQAHQHNPTMLQLDYYMGATLLGMDRFREAIPYYEQAIALQPKDYRPHSNLAWILSAAPIDDLRDGPRALELAQKACELKNYEHWQPLCALASAHGELGEFDEALKWIEKSIELAPDEQQEFLQHNRDRLRNRQSLRIETDSADQPDSAER